MKVLIVDDEAAARARIASLVEEIDAHGIEIVGEAADGMAALDLVRTKRPDVILLDISMPEVDGFDVARHLPEPRPLVIFQTAYHEYALQAFDQEALDYVVKPVKKERLAQALERARARLALQQPERLVDRASLERLGSALGMQRVRPARVLVRQGSGHGLVPVQQVVRFTASEGLVRALGIPGTPATDYTLNELEARLAGGFIRVSRADLVNLAHIQRTSSDGDGSATLTLSDGSTVHVSRRRAADVRRAVQHLF
jgi:DNA-binding LytR/AlgR family response regulator